MPDTMLEIQKEKTLMETVLLLRHYGSCFNISDKDTCQRTPIA